MKLDRLIIYILSRRPIRLVGWAIATYIISLLIVNPFIMGWFQVGLFEIYRTPNLAVWSHFFSLLILLGTATVFIILEIKKDDKPKVPTWKVQRKVEPTKTVPTDTVRDITNGVQVSHIKKNVEPESILVGEKPAKLYKLNDIAFDLHTTPHCLLVGETGSGKSVSSYNLLSMFNKKFRYPPVVLLDAGNRDFPNAIAYDTTDITAAFDLVYKVIRNRQKEPVGTIFKPLLVVLEEAETYMRTVNTTLKKAQYDKLIMKLANMILVARKLNINFIFLAQTAKAADLPSEIRGQFGNRFYMRLNKTASRMYTIPYAVNNLPSGVAYYEKIDAFVQFEEINEAPPLNVLSWVALETMAKAT